MRVLAAVSFVSIAACTPTPASAPASPTPVASAPATPALATSLGDEHCTRGEATPALDASKVKGHSFSRGLGPRAEEKATLADGTSVRVMHLGCEHFVERYTFRLAKVPAAGDVPGRAKELFAALPVASDRAARVKTWVDALDKADTIGMPITVGSGATLTLATLATTNGELAVVYDSAR